MVTRQDRGQAEIIGAILLVVVTLILASLLAVFVFDVGGSELQESPPRASFSFENTSSGLVATHDGGGAIQTSRVEIVVNDDGSAPLANATGVPGASGGTTRADASAANIFGAGTIQVGDSAIVAKGVGDNDIVRIVYIDPDTDQGVTLARYEG